MGDHRMSEDEVGEQEGRSHSGSFGPGLGGNLGLGLSVGLGLGLSLHLSLGLGSLCVISPFCD